MAALVAAAATAAFPGVAEAKTDVVVTDVEVPEGKDAKATTKLVRRALGSSAKRAQWGKVRKVRVKVRVVELDVVEDDGVVRVSCTLSGRIEGGRGARSRLVYGGHPSRRKDLVKKVVGMVADGLMTRLAQMARERAERPDADADR